MSTVERFENRFKTDRTMEFGPGDTIKVNFHPLSDGRPGGSYITIVAADGKTYE